MPQSSHEEKHFKSGLLVRDVILGMADGLTVPFALAAGLSGVANSGTLVIVAGLAEIAAGSISMGLGGYLAAKSEAEHYESERAREVREVKEVPEMEKQEVAQIFQSYGLTPQESLPVVEAMSRDAKTWVDFMMRYELGLEKPHPKRAVTSAVAIAGSYIVGGLIPLSPYIFIPRVQTALWVSVVITLCALLVFGYVKGRFTGTRPWPSALRTTLIGGIAAGAAFIIARLISGSGH